MVELPLTEISRRIEEESRRQAKALHDEAQKERNGILAEAKMKADEIARKEEESLRHEAGRISTEQSASAQLQAREMELTARESALEREVSAVMGKLLKAVKADRPLYRRIFANAIKSASEMGQLRAFKIIVNRKDAELVGKTDAHMEYRNINGGLIIESLDGEAQIDATLENIIDSKKEEIRSALLESMFGSAAGRKGGSEPKRQKRSKAKARRTARRTVKRQAKRAKKKGKGKR